MLENYLTHLISQSNAKIFFKYKIIHIGGANRVVDLMKRNAKDHFLSEPENVICVLDGDQKNNYVDKYVSFIPFESVEKQLFFDYQAGNLSANFTFKKVPSNPGELYNSIKDKKYMTDIEIFEFVNQGKMEEVEEFKKQLIAFLI